VVDARTVVEKAVPDVPPELAAEIAVPLVPPSRLLAIGDATS
jgi:hypothetical protein